MTPRALMIGLDGLDWRLLEPWLDAGKLPHLAALRSTGAGGGLMSTIRPESSIAWTTFATGVNPGQHGVFGFAGHIPGAYELRLQNSRAVRAAAFWEVLAEQGRRACIINVPMTYPPRPFNGYLVGDMLTPSLESMFTHPPELRDALLDAVPDYCISVDRAGRDLQSYLAETRTMVQARLRAALWLWEQECWDLFMVVFIAPDRLQHLCWHYLDAAHPRYDADEALNVQDPLLGIYTELDEAVGCLEARCDDEHTLWVVSDHGFAGCTRAFDVNAWLAEHGYLTLQPGFRPSVRSYLWDQLRQWPLLRSLKRSLPGLRSVAPPRGYGRNPAQWADFTATRAYFSDAGGIRINLHGREPSGVVAPGREYDELCSELRAALLSLTDNSTGCRPVAAVFHRDELYAGPYVDLAPDLILEPVRDAPDPAHNYLLRYGAEPGRAVYGDSFPLTGNHAPVGICHLTGSRIRPRAVLKDAHMCDVAPTVLWDLEVEAPSRLEGRVLREVFHPESGTRPVRTGTDKIITSRAHAEWEDDEAQVAVEERLRGLGYIS